MDGETKGYLVHQPPADAAPTWQVVDVNGDLLDEFSGESWGSEDEAMDAIQTHFDSGMTEEMSDEEVPLDMTDEEAPMPDDEGLEDMPLPEGEDDEMPGGDDDMGEEPLGEEPMDDMPDDGPSDEELEDAPADDDMGEEEFTFSPEDENLTAE